MTPTTEQDARNSIISCGFTGPVDTIEDLIAAWNKYKAAYERRGDGSDSLALAIAKAHLRDLTELKEHIGACQ